jgi:transposase-like protein
MDQKTRREVRKYSEVFKRQAIDEYLTTGASQSSLLRKYGIRYKGAFQKWMKQLGYKDIQQKAGSLLTTTQFPLPAKEKTIPPSTESTQEARIKELERLLEDERLRSDAYCSMIDIAEREFHIPIRKKPNTK